MPPPERPRFPTGVSDLQWLLTDDGSRTLWSSRDDETYHSGCGAAAESVVVYLINSGVAHRFAQRHATRVLEIGFGTATAFLLTAALAEHFEVPLHYTALENRLLPAELYRSLELPLSDLPRFDGKWGPTSFSATNSILAAWVAARQNLNEAENCHCLRLSELVTLELIIGDARHFHCQPEDRFDAVYFDPFSPETSPDLWTLDMFRSMYTSLQPGGTLTSYCVKGAIRRLMQEVGFTVEKRNGPNGGKREVLYAQRPLNLQGHRTDYND